MQAKYCVYIANHKTCLHKENIKGEVYIPSMEPLDMRFPVSEKILSSVTKHTIQCSKL